MKITAISGDDEEASRNRNVQGHVLTSGYHRIAWPRVVDEVIAMNSRAIAIALPYP